MIQQRKKLDVIQEVRPRFFLKKLHSNETSGPDGVSVSSSLNICWRADPGMEPFIPILCWYVLHSYNMEEKAAVTTAPKKIKIIIFFILAHRNKIKENQSRLWFFTIIHLLLLIWAQISSQSTEAQTSLFQLPPLANPGAILVTIQNDLSWLLSMWSSGSTLGLP